MCFPELPILLYMMYCVPAKRDSGIAGKETSRDCNEPTSTPYISGTYHISHDPPAFDYPSCLISYGCISLVDKYCGPISRDNNRFQAALRNRNPHHTDPISALRLVRVAYGLDNRLTPSRRSGYQPQWGKYQQNAPGNAVASERACFQSQLAAVGCFIHATTLNEIRSSRGKF